ncbi:MAG: glycosyltransferase family 39 protein [Elainellaceae cyanobacterium]
MSTLTSWRMSPGWLKLALATLLLLGILFRFVSLDGKIYWHDEAYTSLRAAGYLGVEVDEALFQNQIVAAPSLQQFQTIKPGSTVADTVRSLAVDVPQHPPLYFVMARFWMQWFGGSVAASRALAAVISLFSLPAMYLLGAELFQSRLVGAIAAVLLALSPFDILFAETSRQYSLQTFLIILSSWLLLRAARQRYRWLWGLYALTVAAGLYTQPLIVLTWIAHGLYVVGRCAAEPARGTFARLKHGSRWQPLWGYGVAMAIAFLLFAPWLWVFMTNVGQVVATSSWTSSPMGLDRLAKFWLLSFTSLFIDLDFGFENPMTFLLRLPFLVLILGGFYRVCRRTALPVWLFLLTMGVVPFILIALPDLILGGQRSAITRYLNPCFPAIQLIVAYWLTQDFVLSKTQGRRWVLPVLLTASIVSNTMSSMATSWWSKDLSYPNDKIVSYLNQAQPTVLISDVGDTFTNRGDLLGLSHDLENEVFLLLLTQPPDLSVLDLASEERSLFVFRPSAALTTVLESQGTLSPMADSGGNLWAFEPQDP